MLQNEEFIQEFVDEAISHVTNVETGLLKIDEAPLDPELINNIFRAVHSIKGTAGFFGLKKIVELSHAMENIFGEIRNKKMNITQEMTDLLLASNDCLKGMIEDVANSEEADISSFLTKFSFILKGETVAKTENDTEQSLAILNNEALPVSITDTDKLLIHNNVKHGHKLYKVRVRLNEDLGLKSISPIQFFKSVESIGNIIESYTDTSSINQLEDCLNVDINFDFLLTTVLEKSLLPAALEIPEESIQELDINTRPADFSGLLKECTVEKSGIKENSETVHEEQPSHDEQAKDSSQKKSQNVVVEDTIRVHVSLLNNLLNLASEMVLGRNQLLRVVEKHRKSIPGIEPILQNIDHITTELQEKIMQTRMQPIANVFNKFPRIIRELSKKLGKEIELQLEGSEVELDKSIIEALGDPLTHLVRNSADHGIETPDIREKSGKPRVGTVILKAYHEGGYVNIDVIDDGSGMNIEKIKKKALEKELVSKAELSMMSDQEAVQLVFKPGFSTAEKVTDVSGRGVGMDVVRTNIEKLGGTIEIFTSAGQGTTFRLLLPLTLAIIPSLIVEVGGQRFALPQVNLQEIVRIKPGDTTRKIEFIHNSEVLRLRGRLLPIVHLSDVLGLQGTCPTSPREAAYSASHESTSGITRILVLKIGSRQFGIAVDAIHGSEEILVKPLPKFLKDCKCYSGVTIMGDGKTAMILDPEGIIVKANLRFSEGRDDVAEKELAAESESIKEQQNLLLFKCSGPETFGIDLSLVSRVEEITADEIEKIGQKEFIKFRGNSLRVIRPEDFIPVNSHRNERKYLYVIIPKLVKHPLGILIEKVNDTVQTSIKLNLEDIKSKGIIGSTILNDRIVLLVNIYELFELADPEHYSSVSHKALGEKLTVLVAEDTPFFQKMEKNYLEQAGFKVLMAQNGKEALQHLQDNEIDLVVSDIHMPVMDGLELVKRIREDKRLAHIPAIAVTSMTGDLQKKAGLDAGFDFYEFKLDRERLLDVIERALQLRREAI